jgi:uncharacterized protein YqfA (UPF0365 family)
LDALLSLLVLFVLIIIVFSVLFSFIPLRLWIAALAAGVRIGIITLIGMRLRRVVPHKVVEPLIKATKAGLHLNVNKLEGHYLAGR